MALNGEEEIVVDDGEAVGEVRRHVLELHRVGARRRPFQADDVGDLGEPLDHAEARCSSLVQKVL